MYVAEAFKQVSSVFFKHVIALATGTPVGHNLCIMANSFSPLFLN